MTAKDYAHDDRLQRRRAVLADAADQPTAELMQNAWAAEFRKLTSPAPYPYRGRRRSIPADDDLEAWKVAPLKDLIKYPSLPESPARVDYRPLLSQAKRYTNTVDVSAVRDLYGTVMNEGANRGILVTTSSYGRDSFEFARDKPLTLLSGSELLHLLGKHGYAARIDMQEARRLMKEEITNGGGQSSLIPPSVED